MNDLNIIHTSNKSIWDINLSEKLTYTIVIYNVTDEILENLNIEVSIPKETDYIDDSCTLNGVYCNFTKDKKIYVPKMYPKENFIITIDVKVKDSYYPSNISSYTNVYYNKKSYSSCTSYNDGCDDDIKTYVEQTKEDINELTLCSEIVTTSVIFRNLIINHEVSKYNASLGDTIEYKFIIKNDSSLCINEAFLENISNSSIEFDKTSLYINGKNIPNPNFKSGIYIGMINPKETILVIFKGLLKRVSNLNAISNKGRINFFYTGDATYGKSPRIIDSNEVILDLCPSMSKSINMSKIINVPPCIPKIYQISNVFNYDAKITSKNFLESKTNVKNLFISGCINGRITYYTEENCSESNMYVIEYEIPFKTDILIPDGFNEYVEIMPTAHFVDATLLNNESVYINAIVDIDLINN